MKQVSVCICAVTILAAGCSGTPARIVTATPDEIVVSVSGDAAEDLNSSLEAAGELAKQECDKNNMIAKFIRTENVSNGMIARYECVAPTPKS